jgi:O-antigen ligase
MFEPAPPEPPASERRQEPLSAPAERPAFTRATPEPGNGLATTSLVFGMLGLLIVIPSLGLLFLFSLPFSIAAWVTGTVGRRNVASGLTKVGDGLAHAGIILGIVGVVLGVLGALVWVLLLAGSGWDLEELRRELERGR